MEAAVREVVDQTMSAAEFLDWPGDGTAKRFQLFDGTPRAMSPASSTHARIQGRLAYLVERRLIETRSPCSVLTEPAVQPRLRSSMNVRIPDLGVTCVPGEPGQMVVPDPVLLIEILSPGNERDTRQNVWAYATMPSVVEILLVYSTRIGAELFRRLADASWPLDPQRTEAGESLRLESIDLTCPIEEVYAGTYLA